MLVWWLMAQLNLGGREVNLCAFALMVCVPVYLVGGVSTYKHVLHKHVCVYRPHV